MDPNVLEIDNVDVIEASVRSSSVREWKHSE